MVIMKISFNPLFETMREKGVTSYRLIKNGFSQATWYRIKNGTGGVSTHTIALLCKLLDCTVCEVIEYIPDDE